MKCRGPHRAYARLRETPAGLKEYFEFSDDYIFSSPSTAAVIVMGRNANGLTEWKNKDGKTLKEFELNEK